MGDDRTPLEELKHYLGITMFQLDIGPRIKAEGILERTVRAMESGSTPEEIKKVLSEYVSAWQPDRSYG